ncbi:GHKL domain-containing protein [Fusobacterium hominis]|uniref:histidine kinase n=1 Tax=Fusobacterium hominis TaxID=2764326 RepID=A0A7G9GZK0_9FUSO|nr:GHKL domain-containing protein [Fusobacterium hominis]
MLLLEGIFVYLNSNVLSNLYKQRVKATLKQDTIFVKIVAKDYPHEKYGELFENSGIRFTLINPYGKVEFDSQNISREDYMDNHLDRKEVEEALNVGEGFDIRKSKTLGPTFAYYTTTFKNKYGESFIIRIARNYTKEKQEIVKFLALQILFFLILNFAIHFFYRNYIKRDFYKKINLMKSFLKSGENSTANYIKEEKWFFELWTVLKEWQKKNLENIKTLDHERQTLSLVIDSIDIFIGLLDSEGRFKVKNNVLEDIVDFKRQKYMVAIKYIEIIDIIKKGINQKISISEEVYIQSIKRYFLVTFKVIEFRDEFLITIKDITNRRNASEIQKNFISNVSHELKTPLTNIKGYLIALDGAPDEMRNKFMKVIKENVEKLENIVLDFLNISKIESSNLLNIERVSIDNIINRVDSILQVLIEKKNGKVDYNVRLKNQKNIVKMDVNRVVTILKNLIENGLIYNKNENPEIEVEITEIDDRYIFNVSDNGIGIPASEQYKVFDRFYRVDKSRNRNSGGTGLGLSIVKSLVEQCGGKITVKSSENRGTTFKFFILKDKN